MPKTITVTLDEKEHTITERRSRENAAWRQSLEKPFSELAQALEAGPNTEINDLQALSRLIQSTAGLLLHSVDTIKDLLVEYAPELATSIDQAYDSEILEAFIGVLKLAYPFGTLASQIKQLGALAQQR